MEDNDKLMEEKLNQLKDTIKTFDGIFNPNSLIQDNKIYFLVDKLAHRCEMPSQYIRKEAEDFRDQLYIKLVSEGKSKTRDQLRKELKEKQNIDIEALEKSNADMVVELKDLYLSINLNLKSPPETLTLLQNKVKALEEKRFPVVYEITKWMSACIEDRLQTGYIEYLAARCTYIFVSEDQWKKKWLTWDEFQNDNTKVPPQAVQYMHYLLMSTDR